MKILVLILIFSPLCMYAQDGGSNTIRYGGSGQQQPQPQPNQQPDVRGGTPTWANPIRPQQPTLKPITASPGSTPPQNPQPNPSNDDRAREGALAQQRAQLESQAKWKKYNTELNVLRTTGLDESYRKVFSERASQISVRQDLINLRQEIIKDARWQTSDATVIIGMVASVTVAVTERLNTLLGYVLKVPLHQGMPEPKMMSYTYAVLLEALKKGEYNHDLIVNVLKQEIENDIIEFGGPVAQAGNEFNEFYNSVEESFELPEERNKLRRGINRQLRAIEKEIARYDASIAKSTRLLEARQRLHLVLEDYLKPPVAQPRLTP